ncbi:DsbA family protein [Testudinibacter sp. TR-2022]|uniref:DsbA family protein n=1 Tax=Testudinibacter sp. TR-2022 TaxID=2585029 RepID=UPI001119D390|nr:DsbA family protein [Testudinibacter sp. TR-2022]TNH06856.1 disulfide bond formation protein DsbA [Pasteurellaceae bacterium Phil11]TNH20944.1 disulfide bond formation protein DsbA [Testudinibacter sp. TR-2022]TNH23495.1 disulfide bond formation protein DsbA [Testudinibacter sp. TR-2022]
MMSSTKLTYLFDPLCGWCYGAAPAIALLAQQRNIELTILPTGLFSHSGRTMSADFAEYAWSNDQRIAQLTGQIFSAAYYQNVLQAFGTPFDSFTMVQALAAVAPLQRPTALTALQHARYVAGRDVTDLAVLKEVLLETDLAPAAGILDSEATKQNAAELIRQGQALATELGIQGVPALLAHAQNGKTKVLPNAWLYEDMAKLVEKIKAEA